MCTILTQNCKSEKVMSIIHLNEILHENYCVASPMDAILWLFACQYTYISQRYNKQLLIFIKYRPIALQNHNR